MRFGGVLVAEFLADKSGMIVVVIYETSLSLIRNDETESASATSLNRESAVRLLRLLPTTNYCYTLLV
jgi:hypothetical protein